MSSDSSERESERASSSMVPAERKARPISKADRPNGLTSSALRSNSTAQSSVSSKMSQRIRHNNHVHFRGLEGRNVADTSLEPRSSSVDNLFTIPLDHKITRNKALLQSDRYKGLVVTPIGKSDSCSEKKNTRSVDSSYDSTQSPSTCSADTWDGKESDFSHSRTSSTDNSVSDGSWSGLSGGRYNRANDAKNHNLKKRHNVMDHSDIIRKTLAKDFREIMIKSRSEELKYKQKVCQYLSAEGKVRDYLLSTEKHQPFQLSSDTESSFCSDGNSASSDVMVSITSDRTINDLSDKLLIDIFSHLSTRDLLKASIVCKRWHSLCWTTELWSTIDLSGCRKDTNMVVENILRKLSTISPYACLVICKWKLSSCQNLSDETLRLIARRCPELKHLEIARCPLITGDGIAEIFSNCPNLSLLNIASCAAITNVDLSLSNGVAYGENASFLQLRYVDISECLIDDAGLDRITRSSSFMEYLYLRRCEAITDKGVISIANYCTGIRELSISDCCNVSDSGIKFFVKKCDELRYLSVAKCFITDESVKYIAKYCRKIRYLNLHMCHSITDEGIARVAQNCEKLRALDIGKCEKVTDTSLNFIAVNSPQLRRLSIKGCERVTDAGLRKLATHCRGLKHLNIQECNFTLETFLYLRQRCLNCVIEHTKPEFF